MVADFIHAIKTNEILNLPSKFGVNVDTAILDHDLFVFVEYRHHENSLIINGHFSKFLLEIHVKNIAKDQGFVRLKAFIFAKAKIVQKLKRCLDNFVPL